MSRLDFLLNNLVAAVERRDRLADIERERHEDYVLAQPRLIKREKYDRAVQNRQAADQSVLAIAADVADEWRDKT